MTNNEALQVYITEASPHINTDLREGREPEEVKLLDSLFKPLTHELTVYRAMPVTCVNVENDDYYDPAYLSTSKSIGNVLPKFAEDSRVALLKITLPKGAKAIDVKSLFPNQNDEDEIILMRGCYYQVRSKTIYSKDEGPSIKDFVNKYEGELYDRLSEIEYIEEYDLHGDE